MGEAPPPERRFAVSNIPNLSAWPEGANIPGEPFCLLLLCGSEDPEASQIEEFTLRALGQGLVYLCVCGDVSEHIEEIVDEVYVGDGSVPRYPAALITTSHTDAGEALSFFENDVRPHQNVGECRLWWVVSIGNPATASEAVRTLEARHTVERLSL